MDILFCPTTTVLVPVNLRYPLPELQVTSIFILPGETD
jgi:hypothetical protein